MLATATDGHTGSNQNKTTVSCHCKGKRVDENQIKNPVLKNTSGAKNIRQGDHNGI